MKKVIFFLLLISSLFSVGLTFLVSENKACPIEVEFETEVPQDMNFSCYYVTDPNSSFCEKNKVNIPIKSGRRNKVTISFLHPQLQSFRIDFDWIETIVKVSEITVTGNEVHVYKWDNATYRNDINQLKQEGEWTLVNSAGGDPFLSFEGVGIKCGYKTDFNWIYFVIIFLICVALFYCSLNRILKISEQIGYVNFLFLFIFLLFLFIPGLSFDENDISKKENRTLAVKPQINSIEDVFSFGRNFESWFNDHFWCRDFFMSFYKKITNGIGNNDGRMYKEAFVGKNGWFFLNNHAGYSNHLPFKESELINISNFLGCVQSWCDRNNIKFYFVIAPDKNKVYGENYKYVNKVRSDNESRPNQLIEFLNKNSNVNCIYLAEAIKAQKKEGVYLYYKNDTHWCHLGAYYGYAEIMRHINKQDSVSVVSTDNFTEYACVDGDLNRMCEGLQIEPELRYLLPNFDHIPVEVEDINHSFSSVRPYPEGIKRWKSSGGTKRCVVMGDSFSPFLMRYFGRSFGEAYNIFNSKNLFEKDLQEYIEGLKPDYFILEIVERHLFVFSEENMFAMQ